MLARSPWTTISAEDYRIAFEHFGGSFAVHPRVVALIASLAKRPVRYAGLTLKGELAAAVPLWGAHIVATQIALTFYHQSQLIDIGHSEVVLPVAQDVCINVPFKADSISVLHADNISNLKREKDITLMLAKGLQTGDHRLSAKSQSERRRQTRRFLEVGGRYQPISEFSADEVAAVYTRLFEKSWGFSPLGKDLLPTVLRELRDMLCGHVLLVGDRPVAIDLTYKNETSRWLFANGVNWGIDPEFRGCSPGSILIFRNLERLETEANAGNKTLRFGFGRNDTEYKALWCIEMPAYRLHWPFYLEFWERLTRRARVGDRVKLHAEREPETSTGVVGGAPQVTARLRTPA